MKKITILLISVFVAGISFAQVAQTNAPKMLQKATKNSQLFTNGKQLKANNSNSDKGIIFSEDFESESPTYTIVNHSTSSPNPTIYKWNVRNRADFFTTETDFCTDRYDSEEEIWHFAEDPFAEAPYNANQGKMAYILGEYTINAWYPANTNGNVQSSISTPAIDFTGINSPILSFHMVARWLNQTYLIVQWSDDDWNTVNVIDTVGNNKNGYESNKWYVSDLEYTLTGVTNKSNVKVRFYWDQPMQTSTPYGYSCFLDDIVIKHTPAYELAITDAKIGYFTNSTDDTYQRVYFGEDNGVQFGGGYWYPGANQLGWHHRFGNIPTSYQADSLNINFQVLVKSFGVETTKTRLRVHLMEIPDEIETLNELDTTTAIWVGQVEGLPIELTGVDTVSIYGNESFRLKDLEEGYYCFRYEIFPLDAAGNVVPDSNINNNVNYERFRMTENVASQDRLIGNEIDGVDGNSFAALNTLGYLTPAEYHLVPMTVFHPEALEKVSVLIDSDSGIGSSMTFTVLKEAYDESAGALADFVITDTVVDITEQNKGNWIDINFPADSIEIYQNDFDTLGQLFQNYGIIKLKIEYVEVEDSMPYIATQTIPYEEYFNIYENFNDDYGWIRITKNIPCVHFFYHVEDTTQAVNNYESNFTVYPNPANSNITITNAENQNVTIYNISGQIVKTLVSTSENQNVDVSDLNNGLYFVKIGSSVVKLDIIK